MGRHCACGERFEPGESKSCAACTCDWNGWHDLRDNPEDLPQEDGCYQVRVIDDSADHTEKMSEYSTKKKHWDGIPNKRPCHWQVTYRDWESKLVYAWKNKDKGTQ